METLEGEIVTDTENVDSLPPRLLRLKKKSTRNSKEEAKKEIKNDGNDDDTKLVEEEKVCKASISSTKRRVAVGLTDEAKERILRIIGSHMTGRNGPLFGLAKPPSPQETASTRLVMESSEISFNKPKLRSHHHQTKKRLRKIKAHSEDVNGPEDESVVAEGDSPESVTPGFEEVYKFRKKPNRIKSPEGQDESVSNLSEMSTTSVFEEVYKFRKPHKKIVFSLETPSSEKHCRKANANGDATSSTAKERIRRPEDVGTGWAGKRGFASKPLSKREAEEITKKLTAPSPTKSDNESPSRDGVESTRDRRRVIEEPKEGVEKRESVDMSIDDDVEEEEQEEALPIIGCEYVANYKRASPTPPEELQDIDERIHLLKKQRKRDKHEKKKHKKKKHKDRHHDVSLEEGELGPVGDERVHSFCYHHPDDVPLPPETSGQREDDYSEAGNSRMSRSFSSSNLRYLTGGGSRNVSHREEYHNGDNKDSRDYRRGDEDRRKKPFNHRHLGDYEVGDTEEGRTISPYPPFDDEKDHDEARGRPISTVIRRNRSFSPNMFNRIRNDLRQNSARLNLRDDGGGRFSLPQGGFSRLLNPRFQNPQNDRNARLPLEDIDKLSERVAKYLKENNFTFFFTRKYPFSNHYTCNNLEIDGHEFLCTEQYYMWMKANTFDDPDAANAIMNSSDPKEMKLIGSQVAGFNEEKWDTVSRKAMITASRAKYTQNPELRCSLFETYGTVLVETNPTDIRWGIGLSMEDPRAKNYRKWRGRNWLGFILTDLREELWHDPQYKHEIKDVKKNMLEKGIATTARGNAVVRYKR